MIFNKKKPETIEPKKKTYRYYLYQIEPTYLSNIHIKESDSYIDLLDGFVEVGTSGLLEGIPKYMVGRNYTIAFSGEIFAKKSEVEKAIKNLIEVPDVLKNIFGSIIKEPVFFYDDKYYTSNESLEKAKNVLIEQKPMVFSDSEKDKTYFFKIGKDIFKSDTSSYWLFLYNNFGYLNEEKLKILEQ